jgi:hypothetical protein
MTKIYPFINICTIFLIYVLLEFLIIDELTCCSSYATSEKDASLHLQGLNTEEFFYYLVFFPIKVYRDLKQPEKFKVELHRVGGVFMV